VKNCTNLIMLTLQV